MSEKKTFTNSYQVAVSTILGLRDLGLVPLLAWHAEYCGPIEQSNLSNPGMGSAREFTFEWAMPIQRVKIVATIRLHTVCHTKDPETADLAPWQRWRPVSLRIFKFPPSSVQDAYEIHEPASFQLLDEESILFLLESKRP